MKNNDEGSNQALWDAYKDIYFAWESFPLHANEFYIVTAWNPRSELVSHRQNHSAHRALIADLAQRDIEYAPVKAGNRDFSYFEQSVAINTSQVTASAIADKFGQNAMYGCINDSLRLIPVQMQGYVTVEIGSFVSRCR